MIKFSSKLVPKSCKKKQDKVKKSGIAANFGPKIGTLPLKAGQLMLEGMITMILNTSNKHPYLPSH